MGKIKLSGTQYKKQAKEKKEKLQSVINKTKKIDQLFSTQQEITEGKYENSNEKKENVDLDVVVSQSQNISNTTIPSNDPIEWLPNKWHQEFIAHNGFIQNIDADFMNSARIYGNTTRGLAFREANEHLNSLQNGNFLGAIELIAKFDPFMAIHIARFENTGKGIPSYLSKNIYEELIILMQKHLTKQILLELKNAKYYSIIIDSTPDVSHNDQLCFVIRHCLDNGTPIERFLLFIENVSHKSKELTETVLDILSLNDIPISNCRGQSYDNARNMSGHYSGLQAKIK
ncbi:hypothetical protein QTP88_006361 [Uroleucon formosanum]